MKKRVLQLIFAFAFGVILLGLQQAEAQVTSASFSGIVIDETDNSVPGATVQAIHTPSGTEYGTVTREDGRFNLPNVRTGGPYTIIVSFVGYQQTKQEEVMVKLGENRSFELKIVPDDQQLDGVDVVGQKDDVFDIDKTGASTNIGADQINQLPTLSRSLSDYTRLTPQSSGGSFGGANRRYNTISIDGAVNNDLFGLAGSGAPGGSQGSSVAGTPGGQAGTQPISLDAIEEIQVVLAPYDVKQGNFTGAGINAVTRSGTNNVEGSAYFFARNQEMVGKDPLDGTRIADFYDYQTGFRVGAPIVKNKLFVFLNAEITRREEPLQFVPGSESSDIDVNAAQNLYNTLLEDPYNYDAGSFLDIPRQRQSNKVFARLDWNINKNHQITLRHNYIDAFDDNIGRSANFLQFENNGYRFQSVTNSTVLEWKASFGNDKANNLILGYSTIRDKRNTNGSLFPFVQINDSDAGTFVFGSQRSSVANELDQNIFELTDNFTLYKGKHTITIGTHNEFFGFRNLFINNFNGRWEYNSLENFFNNRPERIRGTFSRVPGEDKPEAEFSAFQLGFYVQDAYDITNDLRLTVGLRADVPIYPTTPEANPLVEATFPGFRTDQTPKSRVLWAPRVGFNWAPTEDVQIRGGVGVFTGRVPFVWVSNQFSNTGTLFSTIDNRPRGNTVIPFTSDIADLPTLGTANNRAEINLISDDFRVPQNLRASIAGDYKLPGGIVATLEFIYSKTLNDIIYQDLNLQAANSILSGDGRPVFPSEGVNDDDFTNVVLLKNTSEGYRYTATAQLRKNFDMGLNVMGAYTYGRAFDVNSGLSSTALSNYEFNQISGDPGNPPVSFSAFDMRHRIVASLEYRKEYGNNFATSIGLIYEARSGYKISYVHNGDVNGDGNDGNDLVRVPADQSDIILVPSSSADTRTPDQIWGQLNDFIENDPYLSERRGDFAERMAGETPWNHQLDLRFLQEFYIKSGKRRHTLQVTFDILNLPNMLNNTWGRQYFVANNSYQLLRYRGLDTSGRPTYSFDEGNARQGQAWQVDPFLSRWQSQIGVRYIF